MEAQLEFEKVFSSGELPTDIPVCNIPTDIMKDGKIWAPKLLTFTGTASSNSDARRLIEQGAVSIDGERISDAGSDITIADGQVLRVGKLKFVKLQIN
jgi:tyrosyl-tRNA synthetase